MKKGSWVFDGCEQLGRVRSKPYVVFNDELLIDIVLYDRNGNAIGRQSPPEGGPDGFEPACTASDWIEIDEPSFPLQRYEYLDNLVKPIKPIRTKATP